MSYQVIFTDELYHHGIRGQKWGVRRYQNTDGSYKSGAQGRYNDDGSPGVNKSRRTSGGKSSGGRKSSNVKTGSKKEAKASKSKGPKKKMSTKKKVAIGLGVAGAALAAYGAYKYSNHIKDQAYQHRYDKGAKEFSKIYSRGTVLKDNGNYETGRKIQDIANKSWQRSLDESNKYKKSTRESIKYLRSQGVSVKPRLRR